VKTLPGDIDPSVAGCVSGTDVTASTCYVVGSTSSTSTLSPVVNGNPTTATTITGGVDVACMNATTCVVAGVSAGSKGILEWFTSGHLTKTVTLGNSSYLNGVTCGATSCLVVGDVYGPTTSSGTTTFGVIAHVTEAQVAPSAVRIAGVAAFQSVACETAATCFAVGYTNSNTSKGYGAIVTVTGGRPGGRRVVPGTNELSHISCGSTEHCWAVGYGQRAKTGITDLIVPVANGKPGGAITSKDEFGGIGCLSATTCLLATGTSQYGKGEVSELVNAKVVRSVVLPKFAYGALSGITCPTSTQCLATGATGFHNPGADYYYTGGVVTLTITAS
jgi:hypothetical protein